MRPGTRKAVNRMVHSKPPKKDGCWLLALILLVGTAAWLALTGYAVWLVIA